MRQYYFDEHYKIIRDLLLQDLPDDVVARRFRDQYPEFTKASAETVRNLIKAGKIYGVCTEKQREILENFRASRRRFIKNRQTRVASGSPRLGVRKIGQHITIDDE